MEISRALCKYWVIFLLQEACELSQHCDFLRTWCKRWRSTRCHAVVVMDRFIIKCPIRLKAHLTESQFSPSNKCDCSPCIYIYHTYCKMTAPTLNLIGSDPDIFFSNHNHLKNHLTQLCNHTMDASQSEAELGEFLTNAEGKKMKKESIFSEHLVFEVVFVFGIMSRTYGLSVQWDHFWAIGVSE